jgi:hypothetical protein
MAFGEASSQGFQNSSTIFANRVIVSGPGEGMFSYFPSVGPDNLVASTGIAVAGTDPYGNKYLTGDTSYIFFAGTFFACQLGSGGITWYMGGAHESSPYTQTVSVGQDTAIGPYLAPGMVLGDGGFGSQLREAWIGPSGDATGAKDTAALVAAFGGTGFTLINVVHLLPGTFYVTQGQVVLGLGQYLRGAGMSATIVKLVGAVAGPAITIRNSGASTPFQYGGIYDLTVDGSSAAANSIGVAFGDMNGMQIMNVACNNFGGGSGVGFYGQNLHSFCEQLRFSGEAVACDQSFVLDGSGAGGGDFERMEMSLWTSPNTGGYTFILRSGVGVLDSSIRIRGNSDGGGGTGHGGGVILFGGASLSTVQNCHLDVQVEQDATAGSAAQTINFFVAGSQISSCYGILDFFQPGGALAFAASNNAGNFFFTGTVNGDATLATSMWYGSSSVTLTANGQTIGTHSGAVVYVTATGVVTGIILQAGSFDGEILYVVNVGTNLVTFAAAGVSHVALGAAVSIATLVQRAFIWRASSSLWY